MSLFGRATDFIKFDMSPTQQRYRVTNLHKHPGNSVLVTDSMARIFQMARIPCPPSEESVS